MRRAVFLDRDGTLNAMVYHPEFGFVDSPSNPSEMELLPGASEAVRLINAMGLLAVVVSNQPGIAKGKYTPALLEATTDRLKRDLRANGAELDGIYYCLHHPTAVVDAYRVDCDCRKPKPGLLRQAATDWEIDLSTSYIIGDGVTDVVAGETVGATGFFVSSRKCYECDEIARQGIAPPVIVRNVLEAVQLIRQIEIGQLTSLNHHRLRCAHIDSTRDQLTAAMDGYRRQE